MNCRITLLIILLLLGTSCRKKIDRLEGGWKCIAATNYHPSYDHPGEGISNYEEYFIFFITDKQVVLNLFFKGKKLPFYNVDYILEDNDLWLKSDIVPLGPKGEKLDYYNWWDIEYRGSNLVLFSKWEKFIFKRGEWKLPPVSSDPFPEHSKKGEAYQNKNNHNPP